MVILLTQKLRNILVPFLLHLLIVGGSTVFFVGPGFGSALDLLKKIKRGSKTMLGVWDIERVVMGPSKISKGERNKRKWHSSVY